MTVSLIREISCRTDHSPGYNWRWCHRSVLAAVHGCIPAAGPAPRILDAGCGTGVSTDYLCHLNPGADVVGVDISEGPNRGSERLSALRGGPTPRERLRQEQRSLLTSMLRALRLHQFRWGAASPRSTGGGTPPSQICWPGMGCSIFLYADSERWEIHRTQKALSLLGAGTGRRDCVWGGICSRACRRATDWPVITANAGRSIALPTRISRTCICTRRSSYNLKSLFAFIETGGPEFCRFLQS